MRQIPQLCVLAGLLLQGCASATPSAQPEAALVIQAPAGVPKPPFRFSTEEERLLDDIQKGCFLFFWHEVSPKTGMVVDRTGDSIVSVAGVGFQLSALPIGVERGWVTKEQAEARATLILESLERNPANRRDGLFYHYLSPDDAGPHTGTHEHVISTIDSALLLCGIITAGEYFGGNVEKLATGLTREFDWRSFVLERSERAYEEGFISLGFKPKTPANPAGSGELLPFVWADAGDEQRLVTFLAVGAPSTKHRVEPELYYKLRRRLGTLEDGRPIVWFPWSGALFTSFFAHCWINYAAFGPDDPGAFGLAHRAPTDWWENARRSVHLHRDKSIENPMGFRGWGANVWGLTASDAPTGYAVPGVFPTPLEMPGATPNVDFADHPGREDLGDGTIAPYAAGSSIMFEPRLALAALRHYRDLKGPDGEPLVWREPDPGAREYGFRDAFNEGKGWVASDYVAIDQGPMLLAIENARSVLIWKLFHQSRVARGATERLGFRRGGGD